MHEAKLLLSHITQVAKRGGLPEFATFSDFFFLKNRFLSDYVVPACPKYISGKLRSFSKNFSKNFFHTTLFENFLPNNVSVVAVQNQLPQGLGTPKSLHDPKIDFFKVRDIDTPIQSRKKNIKLMIVRPLKRFRTTYSVSKGNFFLMCTKDPKSGKIRPPPIVVGTKRFQNVFTTLIFAALQNVLESLKMKRAVSL